jgi:hypothetical protein
MYLFMIHEHFILVELNSDLMQLVILTQKQVFQNEKY